VAQSTLDPLSSSNARSTALLDSPARLSDYPGHAMWGAAMDVGGWLRSLGLGEYEERFRDNKIEADVPADLTDGDLAQLGLPLGDRKRLLKAIGPLPAKLLRSPGESRMSKGCCVRRKS
jgi:hypothetical protein